MSTARQRVLVISLLVLTVVGGFAARTALNADAATTDDGDYVLSGNDPYYHLHAVEHIRDTGETLKFDPMLDYPAGSVNVNPPLWEWSVAVGAELTEPFVESAEDATYMSALGSPAVWGVLAVLPAFLIGRMFGGTWGGLLAGFLIATSPEHMSRSSLGFADHDAIVLFFVTFGFYFILRAVREVGTQPQDTQLADLGSRFKQWFIQDRSASGSAILAGASFGAIGLTWKGFPYAFGIMLAYAGLQFIVNHYRSKDVARPFFVVTVALGLATLISAPYYFSFDLLHFWYPSVYLLAAAAALGTYFLAVQRYPSVLVVPGLLVIAAVFATIMFFVFPDISRALLGRLIYFRSNVLYETIAEARGASFSNLAFTVGPIPFFLYIAGIPWLVYRLWNHQRATEFFLVTWAVVDFVLGLSAIRFLSLIVPSMAILASATTIWLLDLIDLPSLSEAYDRSGGRIFKAANPLYAGIGGLILLSLVILYTTASLAYFILGLVLAYAFLQFLVNDSLGFPGGRNIVHISTVLFVGLLVVFPNAALAVDAAVPSGLEQSRAQQAREQALADVNEVIEEEDLSNQAASEVRNATREARSPVQLEESLNDIQVRLGLSQDTSDKIRNAAADDLRTVSLYTRQLGAFGQSFLPDGWREALTWLADQDTDQNPTERPAGLSWWDYGHWTISVGNHPAVADNFQNGYRLAGQWLVADSEAKAIQLLGARQATVVDEETFEETLTEHGISQYNASRYYNESTNRNGFYPTLQFAESKGENAKASSEWLQTVEEETGKEIRYLMTDNRMLPRDNPNTRRIEAGSIFYAPVTLAENDPDDYVETVTVNQNTGEQISEEELRQLRQTRSPQNMPTIGRQLQYKEPFFDSMYYRTFMGLPAREPASFRGQTIPQPFDPANYDEFYNRGERMLFASGSVTGLPVLTQPPMPGFGLRHFQLVEANDAVRVSQYTPGAEVTGEVTLAGEGWEDVRVTALDDAGEIVFETNPSFFERRNQSPTDLDVPHDSVVTDANGQFDLVAPFSVGDRGVEIRVTQETSGGAPPLLANETLDISREDAENEREYELTFELEPSTLEGIAFHDEDGDGELDGGEDRLANANVTIQGRNTTTGPNGSYELTDLKPGEYMLNADTDGYELQTGQASRFQRGPSGLDVRLNHSETVTRDLPFDFEPVQAQGQMVDEQDRPVEGIRMNFSAMEGGETTRSVSRTDGNVSVQLQPGEYRVHGNGTDQARDRDVEITEVAVTGGTGASVNDEGHLVVDRGAQNVQIEVQVSEAAE